LTHLRMSAFVLLFLWLELSVCLPHILWFILDWYVLCVFCSVWCYSFITWERRSSFMRVIDSSIVNVYYYVIVDGCLSISFYSRFCKLRPFLRQFRHLLVLTPWIIWFNLSNHLLLLHSWLLQCNLSLNIDYWNVIMLWSFITFIP
jgi:hypothetical protein